MLSSRCGHQVTVFDLLQGRLDPAAFGLGFMSVSHTSFIGGAVQGLEALRKPGRIHLHSNSGVAGAQEVERVVQ